MASVRVSRVQGGAVIKPWSVLVFVVGFQAVGLKEVKASKFKA